LKVIARIKDPTVIERLLAHRERTDPERQLAIPFTPRAPPQRELPW